jgi:hypothetical protein
MLRSLMTAIVCAPPPGPSVLIGRLIAWSPFLRGHYQTDDRTSEAAGLLCSVPFYLIAIAAFRISAMK